MIVFKNWSQNDFTHKWDGREITVKAGESKFMEFGVPEVNLAVAMHFAKHLAKREKGDKFMTEEEFAALVDKGVSDGSIKEIVKEKVEAIEEVVEEKPVKKKAKKEEEDFEGLE